MVRVAAISTKQRGKVTCATHIIRITLQEKYHPQQAIYWIIILNIKIRKENFNVGAGVCVTTFVALLYSTTQAILKDCIGLIILQHKQYSIQAPHE